MRFLWAVAITIGVVLLSCSAAGVSGKQTTPISPTLSAPEAIGLVQAHLSSKTTQHERCVDSSGWALPCGWPGERIQVVTSAYPCPTYLDSSWSGTYDNATQSWTVSVTPAKTDKTLRWTLYDRTRAVVPHQYPC